MRDALTIKDLERALGCAIDRRSLDGFERTALPIDKDYLLGEIENLQTQRDNAVAVVHQANGAIEAYRALIVKLEQPDSEPKQDADAQ